MSSPSPESPPSAPGRAVFLSYASQDADAARRICDALRAAGVEVWFDQSELVGGDAWDAKIRKQIAECALFVPVISANTQARLEGYFRIEWKLAARRTHAMATAKAFLLPIVIDDTRDADAHVPDEFRDVQWTRLPAGETSEKFCARVKSLLGGSVLEPGRPRPGERGEGAASPAIPRVDRRVPAAAWIAGAIIALVAVIWLAPKRNAATPPAAASVAGKTSDSAASEADQLITRAHALIDKPGYTRANLAAAEELTRKATEIGVGSAKAWAERAYVNAGYVTGGWDNSTQRRKDAQDFARRALAFDSNQIEALLTLGQLLTVQGAATEAETYVRQALKLRSDDPRVRRALGAALDRQGRREESLAIRHENVRLFPRDALCQQDLANSLHNQGDFTAALEHYDAALALTPFASALTNRAILLASRKGDLPAARETLARLVVEDRAEDGAVGVAMWLGLLERDSDQVLAAAARSANAYLETSFARGAKAASLALAYQIDGKDALARQQWQSAETVLRQHLQAPNSPPFDRALLAIALAGQGRMEEARREIEPYESIERERASGPGSFFLAQYYAAVGDSARAVLYLRMVLNGMPQATSQTLRFDPRWDKLRGMPEFEALLVKPVEATPEPPAAPTNVDPRSAPSEKSVAVLAFADQSPARDSEYFSDGISEELINVLGKIPGLKVPARTSSFYFKGKNVPVPEIAQQLGVAHVIEGSVQRVGDQVKIVARLTKAADGSQVWSDSFVRAAKDVFAVETEIAGLIAQNLSLKFGAATATSAKAVNPEAHRLVLEARFFWAQRNETALARAEAACQRALAADARFAPAHACLADVWAIRGWYRNMAGNSEGAKPDFARARQEIKLAQDLDPTLAEPWASLGIVEFNDGDFAVSAQSFAKAFAFNPNYAVAHHWYSVLISNTGRNRDALEEIEKSLDLDPLSPNALWSSVINRRINGRFAEAVDVCDRALALRPAHVPLLAEKADALRQLGRNDAAAEVARAIARDLTYEPRWFADAPAVFVLRVTGHADEAADFAKRFMAMLAPKDYRRGFVLMALGRVDEAFQALSDCVVPTTAFYPLYWDPYWDIARDDPRFAQLLARLGCTKAYAASRAEGVGSPNAPAPKK